MVIDFNGEEQQKSGASGPIPEDSVVKVRLHLRQPKPEARAGNHPLVLRTKGSNGGAPMFGLDAECEVLSGTFAGLRFWENIWLPMGMQQGLNDRQATAVQIAGRKLRGITEAVRNVQPDDTSPRAAQARRLNDWAELNGMEFGVVVGIKPPKAGDKYVNNNIKRIVTPDHKDYAMVMAGGERITDKPIPAIPGGGGGYSDPGYDMPPTSAYGGDSPF